MATQDPTLVVIDELHAHTRPSAFRDPITGLFPPLAGADGEDEDTSTDDAADTSADAADTAADGEDQGGDEQGEKREPDWKRESRKHERRAKQEREAREAAEKRLKDLEDADKSEQDKALEKAREDAKLEALTEVEKERRDERLDLAVTRAAARTFADTEDALLNIRREIAAGELPDIFDDEGKVQTDALKEALEDLLERKPHLAAGGAPGNPGDPDRGKGKGAGASLEEMGVEDHLKRKQRTRA